MRPLKLLGAGRIEIKGPQCYVSSTEMDIIKPLQKKSVQRDDVIERATVKPQRNKNHVENMTGI